MNPESSTTTENSSNKRKAPPSAQSGVQKAAAAAKKKTKHNKVAYAAMIASLANGGSASDGWAATNTPTASTAKVCKCIKSKCLKLYCECFRANQYCQQETCGCEECQNTEVDATLRDVAITTAKQRESFTRRQAGKATLTSKGWIQHELKSDRVVVVGGVSNHVVGCNCQKSACLKKYCECFGSEVLCSTKCNCVGCKNPGRSSLNVPAVVQDIGDGRRVVSIYEDSDDDDDGGGGGWNIEAFRPTALSTAPLAKAESQVEAELRKETKGPKIPIEYREDTDEDEDTEDEDMTKEVLLEEYIPEKESPEKGWNAASGAWKDGRGKHARNNYKAGDKVTARWEGLDIYYSGQIVGPGRSPKTWSILYDDGDEEAEVSDEFIRRRRSQKSRVANATAASTTIVEATVEPVATTAATPAITVAPVVITAASAAALTVTTALASEIDSREWVIKLLRPRVPLLQRKMTG
jgi:hypothetical protein